MPGRYQDNIGLSISAVKSLPKSHTEPYHARMNRLCVLLGWVLVAGVFEARGQGAEEQYVRIYNLIQQADALNGNGQFALALPKYLEAQSALQRIQKFNPEWNPKVVTYRLGYLAERIEAGASPSTPSPKPAAPTAPSVPAPTPPKTESPPTIPAAPPAAVSELQNNVNRLQAEKAILEAKLREALATQPAAVDPRELSRAQDRIQSLLKENELLKSNLDAGKAVPRTEAETREIEDLKNALAESNRKLVDQSARANVLLAEQQELQQRLDATTAATNEVATLKQSLAETNRRLAEQTAVAEKSVSEKNSLQERVTQLTLTAAAAEALRAENTILKQQLTQTQATNVAAVAEATRITNEAAARLAALQSDTQLIRLEKLALEERLKKSSAVPPPPTAPANRELTAKVDQLTREVTGLRARVEVFEARAIPYTAEELALFQTTKPKVASAEPLPDRKPVRALPVGTAALVAEAQRNFAAKDYAKAEANYLDILRQDEKNPTALANLATIQMEAGKLEDADQSIQQALTADPDDGFNLATFGKIKYQQEKYDEALEALSRAAKVIPQNAEIQNYLGVTLSQKGLRGPAETALRKAIQIDSSYGSAHNNLAVIYATQTPPLLELARWHYQKALAAGHPKNDDLEKLFARKEAPTK